MDGQIVEQDGEEYTLCQVAYASDCGTYYKALAIDGDGNQVTICWDVINPETENEDEACDWTTFEVYG
jgi:hypothetical protein